MGCKTGTDRFWPADGYSQCFKRVPGHRDGGSGSAAATPPSQAEAASPTCMGVLSFGSQPDASLAEACRNGAHAIQDSVRKRRY